MKAETPKPAAVTDETKRKIVKALSAVSYEAFNKLADAIHTNAVEHGFHPPEQSEADFINYQTNNLFVEVAELHNAWRAGNFRGPCDKAEAMKALGLIALSCAEEEYADIVIRVFDQCRRLKIDIATAIANKHAFNTTRPHKHGKLS